MGDSIITTPNKLSIFLCVIGVGLTFTSNLSHSVLLLSGGIALILSFATFILNVSNGFMSLLSVVYALSITLIFYQVDSSTIFHAPYLVITNIMLPLTFCSLGILTKSGGVKERFFLSVPYLVCITCITYSHFLVVAIVASGV